MEKPITFEDLRAANVARQQEWDPDGTLSVNFAALEYNGEIGELLEVMLRLAIQAGKLSNIIKKREREKAGLKGSRASFEQLVQEFGDAQITLDLLAMHYSIDLGRATKLTFDNKSDELGMFTHLLGVDQRGQALPR